MSAVATPIGSRLWPRVEKQAEDGCWIWTGCVNTYGYGCIYGDGRQRVTHRVAYELLVGPVPSGKVIDHLCRNRRCVNPAHMEIVTNGENVLRGVGITAKNALKTHCKNGHPFNEANSYFRPDGNRSCRTCMRERQRRYRLAAA